MMKRFGVRFVIVGRILKGRDTVGYDLMTSNSGVIPTRKEQVQMLASQGYIANATAQLRNNEVKLIGQGTNLSKLKSRQLGTRETMS